MLRTVAFLSAVYDIAIGLALLVAVRPFAQMFGVFPPDPAVFGDINGLFLVVVGLGYLLPLRDPVRYRAYMWLMGPLLKGGGAALFVRDVFLRGSPIGFLLFALSDGALAALTLAALLQRPGRTQPAGGAPPGIPPGAGTAV